jgi:Tfp pilus assembly protein PilF
MRHYFENKVWFPALALMLVTFVAYTPVWRAGFVWDDYHLITQNQMIKTPDGWYRAWVMVEHEEAYPLTRTLRWLEWRMWGENAAGYHGVNVLFHAVNAVLVWLILRRLKIAGAWWAALVFAVHPVNVATVAWISEQKTTLSMLLYAVAILLYLRFEEEGRWRWYGASLVVFLLALLSKVAVVMLPIVMLGCVWWLRGRWRWRDVLYSGPFFVCSLVWGLVSVRMMGGSTAPINGPLSRVITAGYAPWFYLHKAFLPVDLTVIYTRWDINPSRLVSYVPGVLLLGCFALFWRNRRTWGKPLLFGLGYFVVAIFPVSGFFDQGFYAFSLVADHWQYYSIVGVIALTVAAGTATCRRMGERGQNVGAVTSVTVVMVLAMATWTRCGVYESNETLWRDNVAKNPNAWLAHNNLGAALMHAGKLEEAIAHCEQALRIKPDYARAHYNLGLALARLGRLPEAMGQWEWARRLNPDYAEAQNNLAWLLATLAPAEGGDPARAVTLAQRACELTNNREAPYLDTLAVAYAATGRFNDAITTAQQAIGLARSAGQTQVVREIEARLELYRAGRAYRAPANVTSPRAP